MNLRELSTRLNQWRCERPDESAMNEFIRMASALEYKSEQSDDLRAERDSLAAELKSMREQSPAAWAYRFSIPQRHDDTDDNDDYCEVVYRTFREPSPDSPFGLRGVDFDDAADTTESPLYIAPMPATPDEGVVSAVKLLRLVNDWRRGISEDFAPNPTELGRAIDAVCDHIEKCDYARGTNETMVRATKYAHDIVTWLHRDHYSDNSEFEPFDDLLGLLSQIDNMICGWKEPTAQPVPDEVLTALDRMCTPLDDSWLGSESATAQEDARCMGVIRRHILRRENDERSATPGANPTSGHSGC